MSTWRLWYIGCERDLRLHGDLTELGFVARSGLIRSHRRSVTAVSPTASRNGPGNTWWYYSAGWLPTSECTSQPVTTGAAGYVHTLPVIGNGPPRPLRKARPRRRTEHTDGTATGRMHIMVRRRGTSAHSCSISLSLRTSDSVPLILIAAADISVDWARFKMNVTTCSSSTAHTLHQLAFSTRMYFWPTFGDESHVHQSNHRPIPCLICAPLRHYCRRHATLVLHMAVPGLHLFFL
jgi:hypothetical protein